MKKENQPKSRNAEYISKAEYISDKKAIEIGISGFNANEIKLLEADFEKHRLGKFMDVYNREPIGMRHGIDTKTGRLIFYAQFHDARTANAYIHHLDSNDIIGRPIELGSMHHAYHQIEAAEHARLMTTAPVFGVAAQERKIRVTLSRISQNNIETVDKRIEALDDAHKPLNVERKEGQLVLDFKNRADAEAFYAAVKTRIGFSENPHKILSKIEKAHKDTLPVFEVEGKKTGVYVTIRRAPQSIIQVVTPVLQNVDHLSDIVVNHDNSITISFRDERESKHFFNELVKGHLEFSEGNHAIHNKIKVAYEQHLDLVKRR